MNYGFLCPLKNSELAPYFPNNLWANPPKHILGVAHTATEHDKEERLTFFSPRELSEDEQAQLDTRVYDLIHDVEFRVRARRYMGEAVFTPATELLLGRFHFVLQVFGIGSIITARGRWPEFFEGIYWVLLLPLFVSIARSLMAAHGKETMAGLRRLYHSPIGIRVVVLPQLRILDTIVNLNPDRGYELALAKVRDLGLMELVLFYKRACQYPRWPSKAPNVCGVIRGYKA